MTILLINQFFWPDTAATSQLLTDVARELSEQGHNVHAVCSDTSYAPAEDDQPPSVMIHRVASFAFNRGPLGRVFSYMSFYLGALWRVATLPKCQVVLTLTTPPLISLLGNFLQVFRGSTHYIWEMDVYPDVAVDLGYIKNGGFIDRVVGYCADWSRRHADGVIALGECMKERLVGRGIPSAKIEIAENWSNSRSIPVLPRQVIDDKLRILYSGNFGLAHDLQTISGAMIRLRTSDRFCFMFAGGGSRREELAQLVKGEQLSSVKLLPYVKRQNLGASLSLGDIGLVTQREDCCGSVVPSKVYGLMAAGRPILFIGPVDSTPARIIREFGCGWHIPCGDITSLTQLLLYLVDHPVQVDEAGRRARKALLDRYDLPHGTARILKIILAPSHFSLIPNKPQREPDLASSK